ncbi:MAG: insulinase family protein [Acidobacteria bacterium]|nr:insulinase family protein [Acidobacteriota bacterium]MBI3658829.1 insulinase family protein [Acidobacteriota bacterium]
MRMSRRWILPVILLILPAVFGLAQSPIRAPKVMKRTLLNGLSVLVAEQRQTPTVTVHLLIKSGATFDPMGKGGLAHITAEMLKAGTLQRSRQQIADELRNQNIAIDIEVTWDGTHLIGRGPAREAVRILGLITDLAINPAFLENEYQRLKSKCLEAINKEREDPTVVAEQLLLKKLFENTTYARPLRGTPQTLNNITLGDIKEFHNKFYRPNNAILAVVGGIDPASLQQSARRKIGGWVKDDTPPFTFLRAQAPGATKVYLIDRPDLPQAQVRIGQIGIARDGDDYFPVRLLNQMFSGDKQSYLRDHLRQTQSYQGVVEARMEMRRLPGPFIISLSTGSEQAAAVVHEAIKALKLMKGVGDIKDLAEAKKALINQYTAIFQSADQIAARWLDIELYQLGSNYLDAFPSRVEQVTLEDVRRVAERYFDPGGQVIVVAGSAASLKSSLMTLGPVTVLSNPDID